MVGTAAVPLCGAMVGRLLNEEKYLLANLPGYDAQCQSVVPLVW